MTFKCCKECTTDRNEKCHSTCKRYADAVLKNQEERKKAQETKKKDNLHISYQKNRRVCR